MTARPGTTPGRLALQSLLVLVATVVGRGAAMQAGAALFGADLGGATPEVRRDGLVLGLGLLGGSVTGGLALLVAARPDVRAALALRRPPLASAVLWLVVGSAPLGLFAGLAALTHRPWLDPSWVDVYRTGPAALLAVALVSASVFEELFLRGFLQGGLTSTRLGPAGAIAVTATLFSLLHLPTDAWRFFEVAASGVALGLARHLTGSSLTGVAPHVLGNLAVLMFLALG
jgi:membrane protease YdiL (CAAX protease family)